MPSAFEGAIFVLPQKYPPDASEAAIKLVLEQAEVLADG